MCIHGPTLLFKKTFDNGAEPTYFHACSANRNPKECPIFEDKEIILKRAHLQKAHFKSTVSGLAEVNIVLSYDNNNPISQRTNNICLRSPNSLHRNVLIVIRVLAYLHRKKRNFIKITTS